VLAIDESEAAVVRLAYKLIARDGLTTGQAAGELNRLGTRPRRAVRWSHWVLRRQLLDGRGLSGQWPWRREGRLGHTAEDEVRVAIPPILEPEEHQHLLAVLATTTTQPDKWRSYLLRGRVHSPHGRRMQGVPGNGDHRWYQCPQRIRAQRPPGSSACDCGRLHASTVEAAVWDRVHALLSDPSALVTLAGELEVSRGVHASGERAQLAKLDAQIARMEDQVADEYAALRNEGFDPGTARAAIRKLDAAVVALRGQRADVLRFRTKNLAATDLATRIRNLAGRARELLDDPDEALQRKVLDLLDVQVEVLGWDRCVTCAGNGLLSRPGPRRRHVGLEHDRRSDVIVCPDCLRTRHIPSLRITGQIPACCWPASTHTPKVADLRMTSEK
jgi:hypothetical protein